MATKQVSELRLGEVSTRHETDPFSHKRARVSAHAEKSRSSYRPYGGGGAPRSASPTPSYASSSTFSAATTTATALSSRASLSSCRSSSYSSYSSGGGGRYSRAGHRGKGLPSFPSSRSSYTSSCRQASSAASGDGGGGGGADFFPKPPSSWSRSRINGGVGGGGVNRWRLGSPGAERVRDGGSRDHRYVGSSRISRDRHYGCPSPSRRSCGRGNKDYASEASSSAGRKRNRSSSRERGSGCCSSRKFAAETRSGVECSRCLEWCRYSHPQRKPITRTLEMDYYVRTPGCKAAKSKHIDFIDDVAYSREQFIEETVFTCPFTGALRDTVLERNMFPYDVPTDVEHWTLWSRSDLSEKEMEAFVQGWAAENHPHVVEWECDNNEGERSIDWFHVHVFFRVGCENRTGVPRDPASVYSGPYRPKCEQSQREEDEEVVVGKAENDGAAAAPGGGCGAPEAGWGGGGAEDGGRGEEEEAVTDHE